MKEWLGRSAAVRPLVCLSGSVGLQFQCVPNHHRAEWAKSLHFQHFPGHACMDASQVTL